MPKRSDLPWSEQELRWYHSIENYSKKHWWQQKVGTLSSNKIETLLHREMPKKTSGREKSLKLEPMVWEICRRHPMLGLLRKKYFGLLPLEATNAKSIEHVAAKHSRMLARDHEQFGALIKALIKTGHSDWLNLEEDVRERLATFISRNAVAINFPLGPEIVDVAEQDKDFGR